MSLKLILRANAMSCLAFGLLFIAAPEVVSHFLSDDPVQSFLLQGLGALLMVNGALLVATSCQAPPRKELVFFFSAGDFVWVFGTLALILAGEGITVPSGIISALVVAIVVGGLGIAQIRMRKQAH